MVVFTVSNLVNRIDEDILNIHIVVDSFFLVKNLF